WTFQITGPNHEKVNAELLASMYDLSLDQFTPHHWDNLNHIFTKISNNNAWDFDQNFQTDESKNAFVAHPQKRKHPDFRRHYPSLKSFGLKENNRVFQYLGAPSPRNSLNELVVQSAQRKVSNKKPANVPVSNADQRIQGKAAGEKT